MDAPDPERHAHARAAWPALAAIEPGAFAAYLAARQVDVARAPLADLYLACACAARDPAALAAFEAILTREVGVAAAKLRAPAGVADEACQVVRDVLFVGKTGKPAIASYAGRGDLRGWVRVIALREVVRLCATDRREALIGDDALLDALSPASDPALDALKARYRVEFGAAFHAAIAALEARDRTLLRYQLIDGLGVEAIGQIYAVHHATAARWLIKARDALVAATQRELAARLALTSEEVASVLRLIHSRVDLSVSPLLNA